MDAEPEAARMTRWLGPWKEAGDRSQKAGVFRELAATLPSRPEQGWSLAPQWGIGPQMLAPGSPRANDGRLWA